MEYTAFTGYYQEGRVQKNYKYKFLNLNNRFESTLFCRYFFVPGGSTQRTFGKNTVTRGSKSLEEKAG